MDFGDKEVRVLVAYASKVGSTEGIAEFIGEKLQGKGIQTDVKGFSSAGNLENYDAFVLGSAVYYFHWLKEAKDFVIRNRSTLSSRPVWVFSSGPTGTKKTDKKGRDLREVSAPKEMKEIQESISPLDHRIFYGAFFANKQSGATRLFSRMIPEEEQGDFRDWKEIETWTDTIASRLLSHSPDPD